MAKTLEAHDKLIRDKLRFGGVDKLDSLRATLWKAPLTSGATVGQ
jgi:hypothetical protein